MIGKEIKSFRTSRPIIVIERIERKGRASFMPAVLLSILLVGASAALTAAMALPMFNARANSAVEIWWPAEGAKVTGTQPFKVLFKDLPVEQYEMFWQVDGGQWNWMDNNYKDHPHKEAAVGLGGWNWKGSGPYTINFIARHNGTVVAQRSVKISIDNGQPQAFAQPVVATSQTTAAPAPVPQIAVSQPVVAISSSNSTLYVNPNAPAVKQVSDWKNSRASDATQMQKIADAPTAKWLGGWSNIDKDVKEFAAAAAAQSKTAVFVLYNIPGRDCGGYSAGGIAAGAYTSWIESIANAVKGKKTIMILEPDALAGIMCLPGQDQQTRLSLLSKSVETLKNAGAAVYLDAGHATWLDVQTAATRLAQANIARADGFALNVSNFHTTDLSVEYGNKISSLTGGKHFVIDTSRNGKGSNGEWCNPSGRGLGTKPTTSTGKNLVDAYLWIKMPGESDGSCNGAPGAGAWWPEYALELAKNAQ